MNGLLYHHAGESDFKCVANMLAKKAYEISILKMVSDPFVLPSNEASV